jgi:hypothetical protein
LARRVDIGMTAFPPLLGDKLTSVKGSATSIDLGAARGSLRPRLPTSRGNIGDRGLGRYARQRSVLRIFGNSYPQSSIGIHPMSLIAALSTGSGYYS